MPAPVALGSSLGGSDRLLLAVGSSRVKLSQARPGVPACRTTVKELLSVACRVFCKCALFLKCLFLPAADAEGKKDTLTRTERQSIGASQRASKVPTAVPPTNTLIPYSRHKHTIAFALLSPLRSLDIHPPLRPSHRSLFRSARRSPQSERQATSLSPTLASTPLSAPHRYLQRSFASTSASLSLSVIETPSLEGHI